MKDFSTTFRSEKKMQRLEVGPEPEYTTLSTLAAQCAADEFGAAAALHITFCGDTRSAATGAEHLGAV